MVRIAPYSASPRRSQLFRIVFTTRDKQYFIVKNRYLVGNRIDYDYLSGGEGSADKWRATFPAISILSNTGHAAF